jgi:hypothetical protein
MIRLAVRDDMPALLAALRDHHEEHAFAWRFDPALLSMTLAHAIDAPDWMVLTGGGLLLAQAFDSPLGAGRLAVEHVVRAGVPGAFDEIVAAYEAWARAQGCRQTALGCIARHDTFARLYARHGYALAESVFVKPLI